MQEVLRLQNLQKSFGSVRALKNASLTLREGEVVALLGDNGAGKSTLIKAISGVFPIDRGDIYVRGEKVSIRTTREAMDLGIETIHQDTSLAPDLSIARNLFLGREPVNLKWLGVFAPLDLAKLRDAASALLKRVGISKKLDADALVSTLSGGERQSIAISRAMQFAAKVIILDEPTNNLGVEETHGVLRFVKEMRAAGHSVLLITHNIHHVFEVADRIIVMRRGEIVAEQTVADTDLLSVESLITGADLSALMKRAQ
ncbi:MULTISPECIES: ATP-binding cassette domain-containing protein [unclassified Mesorhizobium]|jgi:simple sugar transport system ATP-binding protein|uniref:ATP-binding cassette domain-containing protein n=1 Tax=unclassified Mesorhizobium TaxID=325217 RepID=UPI000FE3232B|nr:MULTISPECIES: ATP-binding cassette domain-containing protein [unclassified Mesorhizobium]MDG4897538.1 ATP-binding cassette domain-containing protein [Mesorhizobium sp. WSM4976]RWH72824.1 MAG: sugar ABC transporter ATP-binding protein [Mesorhizobium sp.]RWL34290.1 MAG: sugar ABC transporter ATP-binding protein [Mesorhizobium sp.]RWL35706.1 MAG: sugar ABC transporter ATP-binding protein [Mesorhizobium sp.]RWL41115.1 MAG: sugar ABC transporter ATP-binding protein [Mesorhizobium sp.]